ncbi:MAG TPA: DegV family protein [Anaerolineales bacterium]|nr:DegV family protein [Anaerolineales bacterium]
MSDAIGLVTDSASDLPPDLAAAEGVEVVPAVVIMDGQAYVDGGDLTREDFYRRLPGLLHPATTASPSLQAFESVYERLFAGGAVHVISVHLTRKLSGLHDIAVQAARRFGDRVHVVDTGQVSLGIGFPVLEAARAIRHGSSLQAVLETVENARQRVRTIALIDSLEYLRRSGRVGWLTASLGNILHVRLLLDIADGVVRRIGQFRSRHRGIDELLALASHWAPVQRWGVMHSAIEDEAREFASRLPAAVSSEPPLVVDVTTVIGAHVGPGSLGVTGLLP